MDTSHPIPQDVTGFQFKLIGSVTVKQFVYLIVPAVIDWVLYYAPTIPTVIKLPLLLLFLLIGAAMAFLPIEGRPLDVMIRHFIEALFAPNQYIYQKTGQKLTFTTLPVRQVPSTPAVNPNKIAEQKKYTQLQAILQNSAPQNAMDEKELAFMKSLNTYMPAPTPQPTTNKSAFPFHLPQMPLRPPFGNEKRATPQPAQQPRPATVAKPVLSTFKTVNIGIPPAPTTTVAPQPSALESRDEQIKLDLSKEPDVVTGPNGANMSKIDMDKQLAQLQAEEKELQKKQALVAAATPAPQTVAAPVASQSNQQAPVPQPQGKPLLPPIPPPAPKVVLPMFRQPHVAKISPAAAKSMGLPSLPTTPNILTGIVRDPRSNVLANILVEVKDQEGNPVRAFKTNQLGQFISATPLNNGIYTIAFEDPKKQQMFDSIQLEVKGEIIEPISVMSHDAREALRRELFSQ